MKNKKIQYFASAAALILGAVLLTTCTVGLGDSVDTKSPKVSITYPPVQSIIKNTFTLRGTASDDNELVGVMITVTNTETDEVFDGYQATVDRATNTWSFAANRRNEDGSFEFEDGKYQIVATAVDGANRKTVASTTYEIDNTAPVLVLNRPGTVGPVEGVKPEVYGSELKLTGSANDDHALDLVSMRVFRADGTQIGEPLTYPNVSGVGMEILLAKHYEKPADADQQALTDRYAAIYDHSTGGTQNFYCLVDISDYAREYDPPANVASADNTRGNVSQAFWLYDGIYSRVFDKSGFGLTMSDLTSVLSGRYASVATAGEVREYLVANQQDSSVWSENAVTFSLDPENSPYYEVVGYNALATNEDITAQASNGTNLTVRVSAGRDQRPLLSDTIRVYLDPCNANGAPLSGEGDNRLLLASIAELAGNTAAIEERNDRLSKTGNDYVISVDVGTLVNGNYYLVKVEGKDQAGNEITDLNGTFGFQVIASGNPPVLVVNSPSDLSYISANSVNFEGTVEAEGGLSSITATVTITRMSGGAAVRTAEPQSFTIVPSDSSPNWAFTLDTATGITPADGLCMATVTLKATDLKNTITEQKLRLYIDHQAPKATITKVTPYYGYVAGVYTVNGTVEATLSLTDNDQLVSYSYTINGGTPSTPVAVTSPVVSLSIPSINTVDYTDDQDLPFTVTLRDRAGNEETVDLSTVIYIDQDTDRPTIELTNPLSLATDEAGARDNLITGPSITGNVADDDGVFSLQLTIYDTDNNTVAAKLFTAGEMGGAAIRKTFSYTFPSGFGDGIYRLVLDAYDINTSPIASYTTEGWFSYDANPPRIDSWVTDPVGVDVINAPFTLSGTGSDDYALKDSDQVIVYQSFNGGTAVPLTHVTLAANGTNTSCDWEAADLPWNFTTPGNPAPVGEYTYKVTVYDWLNNFTTVETVTVQYDTADPVVTGVIFPDETGVNNYVTGSTDFRGTASDEGTGVDKVECSLDGSTWVEATGDKNWSITPSLLNLAAEGAKTLYVRATDDVGNESVIFERPFVYDNSTPSLTSAETAPESGLTLTNDGFSISGGAEDGYQLRASDSVVITQRLGNGSKIQVPVTITSTGATTCDWEILDLPRRSTEINNQVLFNGTYDGTYKYEITVYDAAGQKSDPVTITVQLDSSAPTVTEISAPVAGGVVGTNTSFSGTASDNAPSSGISRVSYSLDGGTTWTDMAPSTNWNISHAFGAGDTEGDKTLRVEAEDNAGNVSTLATRNFVFDRANPTLAITGGAEQFAGGAFSLSGTAYDTHGIAQIVVTQVGDDAVTTGITIDASGAPDYGWEVTGLPRNPGDLSETLVADGEYNYEVHAVDAAGKLSTIATVKVTIDTTAPNVNTITNPSGATGVSALSGTTYVFRGTASDAGVGVAKVWYQITQNATAPAAGADPALAGYTELATSGTWNFSRDLVDYTPTPAAGQISEGVGYYLHVLAEDSSGNRTVAAVSEEFDVDRSNPAVSESEVGVATLVNRRESFELLGAATDTHGIESVAITQSLDSGTPIAISTNRPILTPDGTGFDWTLENLPRGNTAETIGNPSTVNGTYEYQITTTDLVGKTHTIVRRIRFDSVGPTLEFTAPAEGGWQTSGDVTVRGLATDLTAVGGVYYSTAVSAPTIPAAPDEDADWTAELWSVAGGTLGSWEIALTGQTQGSHGVWVSAMDTNGNTTAAIQRVFGVDTALPTQTNVSTPAPNTNAGFTLTGTVADTNALDAVPVTITQSYNGGTAVVISGNVSLVDNAPGIGESFNWTLADLPRNPVSLLPQILFDGSADGEYEFTITATDIAGKTKEVTRSVYIDTQAPTLTIPPAVADTLTGWINEATLPVSGSVTETGSGMDRIEYSLNGGAVQALSLTYPNWSGNIPLSNGTDQTLTITAYDKAGNAATSATYTFSVDLDSPSITVNTPTAPRRTNLASPVVSTYTVTDNGPSGTATVLVTSIGGTAIDAADQTSSHVDDAWTITIQPATLGLLGLASGSSYVVTTTATDVAGNTSTATFSIIVDTTPPNVLTISSPADNATINMLTEIKGTASDAQMLDTVDLYIEDPVSGTLPAVPTESFSGGSAYNWSHVFDTEAWELAGGSGEADVHVIATDEAGNTATLDYTYTVDQESDRPRIRSNNVDFNLTGTSGTILRTKNVIGTIDDDDGTVASVQIWNGETSAWDTVTLSGNSFTYTTPGNDGDKSLLFLIEDAEGETFETGGALPPRFEWGAGGVGEYSYATQQYRVDTTSPGKMPQVYVHREGASVFSEAVELTPNMPFGGSSAQFVLWLGASDNNGVASIEVEVPGASPATQLLDNDNIDATTGITDFTVFRSAPIDISGLASGVDSVSVTINVTITDSSGLESFDSRVILVDNMSPDITHNYPESETDQVFGNITISGLVSDLGSNLPANAVTYQIGYDYDSDDASLAWKTASVSGASWSITDFTSATRIEDYTRQEVTNVDAGTDTFTVPGHGYTDGTQVWIGADELPGGLAHSTVYFIRDATADTFRLAGSSGGAAINIITNGDASVGVSSHAQSTAGNIWYLPVIIRALDKAGNKYVTNEWDYRIKVDPSGDKPTAFVSYPAPDTDVTPDNPIVGGTIRMSGYAEDNIDVSEVYMQIDVNGDGSFTDTDVDTKSVDWYNGGLGKQVSGSRNWTQTINADGEFNPAVEGTRRLIMFRVRARDNNGLYGSWSEPHYFEVDQGVPKYDSLVLVQGGRTRTYEPDMWLSGDWNLTGSILDESNINEVTVGNTPGASASVVSGSLATSGWFTGTSSGSLYGYVMSIPVNTETSFPGTQTSHSFTISATDRSEPPMTSSREIRVQYDNTDPDITAAYGGSLPIRNSNGSYELNSSVLEAESGFDRVMVVFHRPDGMTDGGRVYNPLNVNTYTEWAPIGHLTESAEGLPLREYTGATRPGATSLTLTGIGSNLYAREGYYIRIGGVYYRITDVTGDTITWEGDVDTDIVDFQLVYAIAVDLLNTEVTDQDGDGIIESVTRSGGTYDWSCSIVSTNLPDGQMNIRYVAFDKAGNFARHDDIATHVENNPPLLAQVRLATNLDGSATITENEWNPPYSTLVAGVEQKTFAVDASPTSVNPFTAKDLMHVDIDIVGGNGDLQYSLSLKDGGTITPVAGHVEQSLGTGGEDQDHAATTSIIEITLAQLQLMGDGARNFFFNIWDSTETYATNTSTVFTAELTVTLTVDVVDETAPVTVISPFFWNDADDNSLYGNSRDNGHIELGTEPKVSGQISIRGTAYDDQRLTALWMYVGDTAATGNFDFPRTAPAPATESKTIYGKTYYKMATYTPGSGWTPTPSVMNENGWVFSVDDEYLDQTGHLVSWQLDWDTAEIDGIAAVDRYVRIIAEDKRATPNASSEALADHSGDVKTNNVPYYRIDVVPYVTEVVTSLSDYYRSAPSVFNRTALGHYPVREGESIEIKGFNFNGTDTDVYLNGTLLAAPTVIDGKADSHLGVNIGSVASSGNMILTVAGVDSINNDNNNNVEYNQLPNTVNNNLLRDDVIFDVWEFKDAAVPKNGVIQNPTMKISPTGRIGFSYSNAVVYFSMPGRRYSGTGDANIYSQTVFNQSYGWFTNNTFTWDPRGETYGTALCPDTDAVGVTAHYQFFARQAGRPANSMSLNDNYNNTFNAARLDSTAISMHYTTRGTALNAAQRATWVTDIDRIKSPSMAASMPNPAAAPNNTTNRVTVHIAYYDKITRQVRYRQGFVGATARDYYDSVRDLLGDNGLPDDGNRTDPTASASGIYTRGSLAYMQDSSYIAGNTIQVVAASGVNVAGVLPQYEATTPYGAGQFVDLGVIQTNAAQPTVVIAWYDTMSRQLMLSYNATPNTYTEDYAGGQWDNTWVDNTRVIDANGGQNVKMAIDSDGGIHLAYYNTNAGDLKYAYLESVTAAPQTVVVDSFLAVGARCTIDVAKVGTVQVPHISYQMNALSGTPAAAKYAYRVAYTDNNMLPVPAGTDSGDRYTGSWEITSIPTDNTPIDDQINVGVHKVWNGVGRGDQLAIPDGTDVSVAETNAFPVSDSTIIYGNGTMNAVVAYAVEEDGVLEMAQKK